MAVYTTVTEQDIATLLSNNLLGTLKQFSPMSAGISNTHYKLTTSTGEFVLTIFEHADIESLQTKLMLEEFLVSNGYPASAALPNKNDYRLQTIVNKPCKLSILLPGQSVQTPNLEQLNEVGQMLAELHLTSARFQFGHELLKNDDWISRSVEKLLDVLPTADALMLQEELGYQHLLNYNLVPQGVIHTNFFPDNILFRESCISAVLDFNYACFNNLILDLGFTINAWCTDESSKFQQEWIDTIIYGYQSKRPLNNIELELLEAARRTAALQVWIERLLAHHFPKPGNVIQHKHPDEYRIILQQLSLIPKI